MSLCPSNAVLEEFALGRLNQSESEALEQHLADCAACVKRVRILNAPDSLLNTLQQANVPQQPTSGSAAPPCPGIPERIGRYRINGLLGEGEFGRVYRGMDEDLARPVAIKVPKGGRLVRAEDIQKYVHEARAIARLAHPQIVTVYDFGHTDDVPVFFVSKFIDGGNLADRLRSGRMSNDEATSLVAAIADALHHSHLAGHVHRDVKPANILMDKAGHPYIADFGLALSDDEWGDGPTIVGTLAYMSPEQAGGKGHRVDGRSDIYSLGAVLYELLCGRPPLLARNMQEQLDLILNQDPKPPRQIDDRIPSELERICLKALAKRPADRYTTAKDLADELRSCVDSMNATRSESAGPRRRANPSSAPFSGVQKAGNTHDDRRTVMERRLALPLNQSQWQARTESHGEGQLLGEEEARRPIALPFQSLGTLFKGRDQFLSQLRKSLSRGGERGAAITARAVHGLGGVGKTRLAVEYAWQYADDYTAALFVTADSPNSLRRNLAELAGPLVLNLPEQSATEEDVRVAAALRWLAEHPGWFLILDNVDTEEAADYVEQLLPRLQRGHVLITSRLARWRGHVQLLELNVLSAEDAAEFLLQRTEPQGSRGRKLTPQDAEDASALALELDGLALALEQAGAYIVARRKPLAEYLELWRLHDQRVQTWHNQRETQYPRSIAVTWQTTLDQLGDAERRLLNLLSWCAAEPVPIRVLSPSSVSACLEELPPDGGSWDAERIEVALANLADYSMLRWEGDAVTVHRVMQQILRAQQSEPRKWLTATLRLLERAVPAGDPDDVRTWPAWERLRPHVACVVLEGKGLGIAAPTGKLMGELGALLRAKALHHDAEPLERDALALAEQQFGPESAEVALRLNNLAQTLKATNRLAEAEPLMRRALAIDEQAYGAEHPTVAIRLNNLAVLLQSTNRLAEAEPLLRRALAINEQSYGANHPEVATNLNNLAQLLQDTNQLAEAEPLARRALAIDEEFYGAEHPAVAIRLNNLAVLLQSTNRWAKAELLLRRALAINERSYGAEHPLVATNLNNLAVLLQATNRLAEVEPLLRRALAIDEQSYGTEHPEVATDLNNLARLLQERSRSPEAEPLLRRALAIDEQSYGAEHPAIARDVHNLALLLKATKRLAEAEPLLRRALAIDERSYGTQHPNVAIRLNNLARLMQDMNRLADAEPLLHRALAIDEQSYGAQHSMVAIRLNNLARLLQAANRQGEAEPLLRRALAIDEQSCETQHPEAADLSDLAKLLQDTNRHAEVEPLLRRALAIDEQFLGPEDPAVAADLNNLARLLRDTNRQADAEPICLRGVRILMAFRRSSGCEHPRLQAALDDYISLLEALSVPRIEIDQRLRALHSE